MRCCAMSNIKLTPCPSYPGYSVSQDGRVFSHRTRHGIPGQRGGAKAVIDPSYTRELSGYIGPKGYISVSITSRNGARPMGVHELVLDAFHGPRPKGMVGRHLDGNPANNSPGNLRWGTHWENAQDRQRHGRYSRGEDHHNAKLLDAQVAEIKSLRIGGVKVKALASRYGVGVSTIEDIIYGRSRNHIQPNG